MSPRASALIRAAAEHVHRGEWARGVECGIAAVDRALAEADLHQLQIGQRLVRQVAELRTTILVARDGVEPREPSRQLPLPVHYHPRRSS